MKSVLKVWVMNLGIRQQGVLLGAFRGCDTAPKNDASKRLTRALRAVCLNTHVGDPKKSKSYIEYVERPELIQRMHDFVNDWDHYPMHYVMHLVHAAEVIGYYHPDIPTRAVWNAFYLTCCHKMHVRPELADGIAERLDADEEKFGEQQEAKILTEEAIKALELALPKAEKHSSRFENPMRYGS